jgi:drug/metabolite transporter (DMT)-like permease
MTTSDSSDPGGDPILTPSSRESPTLQQPLNRSRQPSPTPLRISSYPEDHNSARTSKEPPLDEDLVLDEMNGRAPRGLSHTPLLRNEDDKTEYRGRRTSPNDFRSMESSFHSHHTGRSVRSMNSVSPKYSDPENLTRRKYYYAAFFLVVSLVSFVVQTETAVYIQHELKWNKAYCMLWLTHGSWVFLWPIQFVFLRVSKRKITFANFWRKHKATVHTTAQMVQSQDLHLSPTTTPANPWPYMIKATAFITTFLTVAGGSWYVAVDLTSPSDLTAIYNCSAFFAYVFSILLLNDKFRMDKMASVFLAILGVLVVAYGDSEEPKHGSHSGGATNPNHTPEDLKGNSKLLGNLIIGVGSVMYGLYEVLYKKYACPPDGVSPSRGMTFANTFGSMVGTFTLCVLWIPLPILHWTGVETFEMPRGKTAALLAVSTLSNAVFSGAFLVLMSLTSPVLSSVAALLTIFLVAITDWLITGKPLSGPALLGGVLIIVAFLMLSWATYREMSEEAEKRAKEDGEGKWLGGEEEELMGADDGEGEDELGRGRRRSEDS